MNPQTAKQMNAPLVGETEALPPPRTSPDAVCLDCGFRMAGGADVGLCPRCGGANWHKTTINPIAPSCPEPHRPVVPQDDTKDLKFSVPREDFGLAVWAARECKPPLKVAEFTRQAINEKTRAVVADMVKRGKKLPQWVAEALDKKGRPL